jgi:hypothetical protein
MILLLGHDAPVPGWVRCVVFSAAFGARRSDTIKFAVTGCTALLMAYLRFRL